MIALIDDLPLLEFANGRVCAFRREWLRQNLLAAAERAGYRDWWLADHVAQSVTNYLLAQYDSSVLAASDLRISVAEVLANIGYAEIATHFDPMRPASDISLLEIAGQSGPHELTFCALLKESILREIDDQPSCIRLLHLSAAIKRVLGVKLFTEECACFREEIVAISRALISDLPHTAPVSLVIR